MVYFDNSATTKPCARAIEKMNLALGEVWGNPSALYGLGMDAEQAVTAVRRQVARRLRCDEREIVFTSGGTESNNTALFAAAQKGKKRGRRIVSTAIEHPSVLETLKRLEAEGFEVVLLSPQANGVVAKADLQAAITPETILVSMMLVNNETGAVQPVAAAAEAIRAVGAPALLHCDAVQAFGKLPFSVAELGVDLLSASAHKIHGPKGVGFLYCKKSVALSPFLTGGGQERGLRSGTENVPGILGLGGALEDLPEAEKVLPQMRALWEYAAKKLCDTGFCVCNSTEEALPYILNISVPGYRSETLLHFLESERIFVSSGSACAKGAGSYVLRAAGLSARLVDSALRLSFSRHNTEEEVDRLVQGLQKAVGRLRRVE